MPVRAHRPTKGKYRTMSEAPNLWTGQCPHCHEQYEVLDDRLREVYPEMADVFDEGTFEAPCRDCSGQSVTMTRTPVKVIPFTAWNILPPPDGYCVECAREHHPGSPHDATSLRYQYYWRQQNLRAGGEERWPTWADAMAHCEPHIRSAWIQALRERGVEV